jgi:hypothetical protein
VANRAELQRRLASEFSAQGWPYEHDLAPALIDSVERGGPADGQALARQVPANYLDRNGIEREQMAKVLDRALGGQAVEAGSGNTITIVSNDNRNAIQLGEGASIVNSQVNTTGNQMVVQAESSKEDVLATAMALVRAGLTGDWNEGAARDLGQIIDGRDDITIEDVREMVRQAVEEEKPEKGRIKELVTKISTSAVAGALSTGIIAALGALF